MRAMMHHPTSGERQEPDMQHADGEAGECAHGSKGDCAEDPRNVVAAPKVNKETHRAENGGEPRSKPQEVASP